MTDYQGPLLFSSNAAHAMTTTDVLFAPEKLPDGDIRDHIRLDNNGFVVANVGNQDRLLFWIPAHLRKDHLLPRRHLLMQLG